MEGYLRWIIKDLKKRHQELLKKGIDDADLRNWIKERQDELQALLQSSDGVSEDTQKSL